MLYETVLRALSILADLTEKLPDPGLMPQKTELVDTLKAPLVAIDRTQLLQNMRRAKTGAQAECVSRLHRKLEAWVGAGGKLLNGLLQAL